MMAMMITTIYLYGDSGGDDNNMLPIKKTRFCERKWCLLNYACILTGEHNHL